MKQARDLTLSYIENKYGNLDQLSDHLEEFLESTQPSDFKNKADYNAMTVYASTYLNEQQSEESNNFGLYTPDNGLLPNEVENKSVKQVQVENTKDSPIPSQTQASQISSVLAVASSAFVYDKYKAVDYAHYWYDSHNPAYPEFNNDCTNFASQAVHAGGYAKHSDWYVNKINGDWKYSRSWSLVYDFFNYWTSTRGHSFKHFNSYKGITDYAHYGDIIIFYNSSKGWYHAVIETNEIDGVPRYSAHTNPRYDHPLSDVKDTSFFVIKY